ncbi:LytTR family DNA-binding domain-containing protein [Meridianimarinicoccus sp. RP-17]|uniref:LytTR family DNA-binding domain-containing protein n=1 Tax=Meridianimarinicoccus zhengii TaxID=2056810 RepID=UPI000DAD387C|nr:LytTR family DNA-binding domain-containing protein [Phycocomes zhengii]
MRERIRDIGLRLMAPLGVGLVLGLIGPFGTYYELLVIPRIGYWLAVVSLNWALADTGIRRVDGLASAHLPVPHLSVPLLGALLVSIPATGVVVLANGLSGIGWPASVGGIYWKVLVLLAAISLPAYAWAAQHEDAAAKRSFMDKSAAPQVQGRASATDAPAIGPPLFLARLRGPLPGRLLCLEMQDHYLVVHTTGGTEMILCRMEDAARELEGHGRRVHRSWWVAEDAVEAATRNGQRWFLRLVDGRTVPVGRSFQPALRDAGWL